MTHHHHEPPNYGRLFAIGVALNIGYVLLEVIFGLSINSLALLADAAHNFSDVAGLLLAWLALAANKLKANQRHTFAWKKASIMASFVNAAILLIAMGALAWESISRFEQGSETQPLVVIWVAGVGVIINAITAALFIKGSESDLNIKGAFLHMAADALVSLAVVISGIVYLFWPIPWLDPLMSLLVAAVVVVSTWGLFKHSLHLLFDGVPDSIDTAAIIDALVALPAVEEVHDLHVWAMSTTENSLSAHLVKSEIGISDIELLNDVRNIILRTFKIHHITVQIETADFADQCVSLFCTNNNETLADWKH